MSRRAKAWAVAALAVALVVLVPLGLSLREQWRLKAYRNKLMAAGEKLTVDELAPKGLFPGSNSALFLRLASTTQPLEQHEPSVMLPIKPGVARVAWRQPQCMEEGLVGQPATNVWPSLAEGLQKYDQTLHELHALVRAGGIDWNEDYRHPNTSSSFTKLIDMRHAARAFSASAMLALHQGRMLEALEDVKTSGLISQLAANKPIMIDQSMGYACMASVSAACWEALQADGWSDDQLAQLQSQWDHLDIMAEAKATLAMERVVGSELFQAARASRQGLEDVAGGESGLHNNSEIWNDFLLNARTGMSELITAYPRYWGWKWIWSYRDEQRYLAVMQSMIETTRDEHKRHAILTTLKDERVAETSASSETSRFRVVANLAGDMEIFITGQAMRAQTVANMTTAAIALERFRLAHHAYPASLAELVPKFVPTVPVNCMDGRDLRYHLKPDGTFLLYSVGADGVDNGGDATPEKDKALGFRNGRDWVWPRPATAEEVTAYEIERSKLNKGK